LNGRPEDLELSLRLFGYRYESGFGGEPKVDLEPLVEAVGLLESLHAFERLRLKTWHRRGL
jgi:hypothetical protein